MSYSVGSLVPLEALQVSVFEAFETAPEAARAQRIPFMEFVYSPENRGNLEQLVSPGNGKTRIVEINYMRDFGDSAIETDVSNPDCSTGSLHEDQYYRYEIDTSSNRRIPTTFTRANLEKSLHESGEYLGKVLMLQMLKAEEAVAAKSATEFLTLVGRWADTVESNYTVESDALRVETLQSGSNYALAPFTWEIISDALMLTNYNGTPYIFGGNTLNNYLRRTLASGNQNTTGVDFRSMAELYGVGTAYDKFITSASGDNDLSYVIQPGAVQLLTYTAQDWKSGVPIQEGSNYVQMTMLTPRLGIPVDVMMTDNCGSITVSTTATTKLVGLPSDLYNDEGEFDGVTHVNKIEVNNTAP